MTEIIHVVGNRPQFIKLGILFKEIQQCGFFSQKIIHTGQHSSPEMSDIFFTSLQLPAPDINLKLDSSDADMFIAKVVAELKPFFIKQQGVVFVYGDTNTTLAAALAARRSSSPLFHFEGGVRTGDDSMPEEINRILTDRLSNVNYCCTKKNHQTLLSEGYSNAIHSDIILSGDLMLDAYIKTKGSPRNVTNIKEYIACTIHRVGNILSKENLSAIIEALNRIHRQVAVIMPVHPHTKMRMEQYGLRPEFITIAPLDYPGMKTFLQNASAIITDSGGASREAFFSKKKSVVVMEKPFWPEIIEAGCSINCFPDAQALVKAFEQLSLLSASFERTIFGTGQAAEVITKDLVSRLN